MYVVVCITRHLANASWSACFSRGRVKYEVVIDVLEFGVKVES